MGEHLPTTSMDRHQGGIFSGRPALRVCVFYALGIACGDFMPGLSLVWLLGAIGLGLAALLLHFKSQARLATIFLLSVLFVVGIAQFKIATSDFPPTHIGHLAARGGVVVVTGEIAGEPDLRDDRTYLVIEVDSVTWRGRTLESSGRLLLKINQPTADFAYGDRIIFKSYLNVPGAARSPGGFDYARYLREREIYAVATLPKSEEINIIQQDYISIWPIDRLPINSIAAPVREKLLEGYREYLLPENASLLSGFVLGEKRGIPAGIARLFADTGTLHLMAVSGSNVAVVVLFVLTLLKPLRRKHKLLITLMAIVLFSYITRNEPSVVRASIMAAVGLIGFYRRKDADPIGLLGFAGLLLLMIKPLWLFNAGFQLSMAAAAGILYVVPEIADNYPRPRIFPLKFSRWVVITILVTLSAQIAVLPVTAEYFNRLPVVGVIANLPMIALASFLTIAGLAFLPFILIGGLPAQLFAWPIDRVLSAIPPLLDFFANLPLAVINVRSPGLAGQAAFYALIYSMTEMILRRRWSVKAILILLGACAILVGRSLVPDRENESLTFLDCGPDRAVLYTNPEGGNYLWFECLERGECRQIELTLLPYLREAAVEGLNSLFSTSDLGDRLGRAIAIDEVIHPVDFEPIEQDSISGQSPYHFAESILNKRVKLVCGISDNNSEPSGNGYYYELTTDGGVCILAANISPPLLKWLNGPLLLMELPWSMQPYGIVPEALERCRPRMLVFSPDGNQAERVRDRGQLTYFDDRTWATSIQGSFRVRFEPENVFVDYMIKP